MPPYRDSTSVPATPPAYPRTPGRDNHLARDPHRRAMRALSRLPDSAPFGDASPRALARRCWAPLARPLWPSMPTRARATVLAHSLVRYGHSLAMHAHAGSRDGAGPTRSSAIPPYRDSTFVPATPPANPRTPGRDNHLARDPHRRATRALSRLPDLQSVLTTNNHARSLRPEPPTRRSRNGAGPTRSSATPPCRDSTSVPATLAAYRRYVSRFRPCADQQRTLST